MPANRKQKEVELQLKDLNLVLCFKTRGLTVFEQLCGKPLKALFEELQSGEVGLSFIVNGIAAGLAHDSRFKRLSTTALLDRIESMIDASFSSLGEALATLSPVVLDALMLGIGVDLKEQQAAAAAAPKDEGDSGPLDLSEQ